MSARSQSSIRWRPGLSLDIDPDSDVRYTWHWDDRIPAGENIASYEFVVEGVGEVISTAREGMAVMGLIRGVPRGARTRITCRIVTDGTPPERLDRSVLFVGRNS